MSAINYTYFITIGGTETQVYPSGDWSLKIAKAEEDFPFCKDYRIKFDGEFIFAGDDYDLIKTADCCDKIDLRIQCNGVNYWYGYFAYPYDFEFDEDRCEVSGTPKPLDKYYYFDLYADSKFQLATSYDSFTYQRNFPTAITGDLWRQDCIPCKPIMDIIQRFTSFAPLRPAGFPVIDLKSAFFNDSADGYPSGPYTPGAGINYVTDCANKLDHVVMAMTKDVREPASGPPWTEWPEMSWNDLMEILHNTFNTWWYIDENGDMRIEHIYFWELYFIPPVPYDLTIAGIDNGRWIVNSSKYDYRNEEIPKEEIWNWSDLWNTFDPGNFAYYGCFLPGTSTYIKEYSLNNLTTDMEYIAPGTNNLVDTPPVADLSDSDYMFLRCITKAEAEGLGYGTVETIPVCADYVVWFSRYIGDGADHLNAHLSSLNLLANYWMYDRPLWTGFGALGEVFFKSTWKNLRQMELSFPVCCDGKAEIMLEGVGGTNPQFLYQFGIEFLQPIITQYGDGELYTGTIKDGMLSLQLIFEDLRCKGTPTVWPDPICEL